MSQPSTDRRSFLGAGLAATGALVIGIPLAAAGRAEAQPADGALAPGALLRIETSGAISLVVPYAEMGQGTLTAMAMLVAEELEVEPGAIRTLHAPGDDRLYANPAIGEQVTGGSTSVRAGWKQMRGAGAAARIMLVQAAASRWRVDPAQCRAEGGAVLHPPSQRRATYGELVAAAALLPVPADPPLKTGPMRVLGRSVPRLDAREKVTGAATYGIDVRRPGMLHAAVMACPVIGGRLDSVADAPALAVKGVTQVVRLTDAVAVIARHTAAARKGLAALDPKWTGGAPALSSAELVKQCDEALARTGVQAVSKGNAAQALAGASSVFEATWRLPMLAHAAMEPLACTVEVKGQGCAVWAGSQVPARARREVASALGLPESSVEVHNHLIGGGFGRRLQSEWIVQAALIARQVQAPLKVTWSREEDIRHDSFRFHNHSRLRVGLDEKGMPVAWDHRVVGPSVLGWFLPAAVRGGVDPDAVAGAAGPYALPNVSVDYVRNEPPAGLMAGNWRGVGETRNAVIVETAIEELAARAGIDPVDYRRRLLPPESRLHGVLDRLVAATGWKGPRAGKAGRGVAVLSGFGSHIGVVAEAERQGESAVRITRLTCVIDCGQTVNPNIVRQQIEGGLLYGLSAACFGEITIEQGQIQQSNFHDYPVLRMSNAPQIEVIVMDSAADPGGVGEPGTAVVAPAVVNAIAALTGKRHHALPLPADLIERV